MKRTIDPFASATVKLSVDAQIPRFLWLPLEFSTIEMEKGRETSKSQRARMRDTRLPTKRRQTVTTAATSSQRC